MKRSTKNSREISEKPITMPDLGQFTEEVILPGVGRIVGEKISELRAEMRAGFVEMRNEMRQGFSEVSRSIRVLAGEVAEIKVREEDQDHETRIRRLEKKSSIYIK